VVAPPPQQLHAQGGHVWPLVHAGQAQPQPPEPEPPPPPPVLRCWQTPDWHGPAMLQAMPRAIHMHASAESAAQLCASVCAEHGSLGGVVAVPPSTTPVPVVPGDAEPEPDAGAVEVGTAVALPEPLGGTGTGPLAQSQLHGGQVSPGAQTGHAQAHVPGPDPGPVEQPPPPEPPPPVQSQLHGGQLSPGAQAGHAQVHIPPPALPASTGPVGGQSHATAGQAAFDGQATGCAQAQPPPVASAAWQKPAPPQS
jgi:hypothetical protein